MLFSCGNSSRMRRGMSSETATRAPEVIRPNRACFERRLGEKRLGLRKNPRFQKHFPVRSPRPGGASGGPESVTRIASRFRNRASTAWIDTNIGGFRVVSRGTTPADEPVDHSAVKDNHDEDADISVSLETLARHISETPRNELVALRAAFDQQISSIEARLEASNHQPAIDATVTMIARVIGERIVRAQQRVETTATQALAANSMLRKALDNAQQQLASAQTAVAAAEADRTAIAAQHREVLNEK